MGRIVFFFIFILASLISGAQDTITWSKTISTAQEDITDFSIDNIGNIYLVINNSRIKKITVNGDSLGVFDDVRRYGKISSIDPTNSLKLLVFYREISTILVLDRFLAVKNVIDLRKNNILQPKAIKLSYDNNIWVYDEFDNRIKKIDDNGKLLSQSADLRTVFSHALSFGSIFDDNQTLYLYDKDQGWFLFDYYGAFIKKYAFINWHPVQVFNAVMIGVADSVMVSAKKGDIDFRKSKLLFPAEGIRKMELKTVRNQHSDTRIYYFVLYRDRFTIYAVS